MLFKFIMFMLTSICVLASFETGHHLVLEPEHSDLSENQVNAKSDSKQQSREKDAGEKICNTATNTYTHIYILTSFSHSHTHTLSFSHTPSLSL